MEQKPQKSFVVHCFDFQMVGKDIRKLSMLKNASKKRKQARKEKHRGRPRYKACDPFSGRSYQEEDPDTVNLEPDASELDSGSDEVNDEITTYKSYKEKPKYRRDSRAQSRVVNRSYFCR